METNKNLLENDLVIDSTVASHLKETIQWARFLGVAGFIISALIAIGALVAGSFFTRLTGMYSRSEGMMAGGSIMVVYLGMAAITFFMSRFLFQFARKANVALKAADQENLTIAFRNLKVYFRFAGIIAIISLIFTVLAAIGLMLAASFSRY